VKNLKNKIGFFLTGNQQQLAVESKIFNIVAILASLTCFISFVSNLFIGFPIVFNIILLICSLIFGTFYYLSVFWKITRPLEIPIQIVASITLTIVWLFSQGIEGAGTFYFFLVTFAFIYSSSHKKYWLVLLTYVVLALVLVIINYYYPDSVRYYQNRQTLIMDLSVNMIVALVILGITAILLKQNYDRERIKVEKIAEELKTLNATKDKFFSIISHDLRNPFNNLLGLSRQLRTDLDKYSKEEIRERVMLIEESSKRGYELLENLLEWSLSQKGKIRFNPLQLKLYDVFQECLLLVEQQIVNKKINLVNEIKSDMLVTADYDMLKIILRNLITNSVKYSNERGRIKVKAEINLQDEVVISVTDNGIGIPENEINKLFRIDTKYSTPGTANEFGTGLGLILCKEFVEKHGGKILVESKLNSGSTFRFNLPN
jgi:two-component system, sensor histidine kinase and response regulator